jgi:hypothetical protein
VLVECSGLVVAVQTGLGADVGRAGRHAHALGETAARGRDHGQQGEQPGDEDEQTQHGSPSAQEVVNER